jgi:hypothetical protein
MPIWFVPVYVLCWALLASLVVAVWLAGLVCVLTWRGLAWLAARWSGPASEPQAKYSDRR